jgi:hypothetical protein
MDRKAVLKIGITGLTLVGLIATAYPFMASLAPSERAVNDSIAVITLPPLEPGTVYSTNVNGSVLFLLKPNQEQLEAIKALDAHVWEITSNSYKPELGIYAYWGHSPKWGCSLQHQPPQESRLLEWDENAKWLGGYWDGWCEVSYDYAGRAIKTYRYTYNGYTWYPKSLRTPRVFEESRGVYLVSIYQR